jgi:hypothetical protein
MHYEKEIQSLLAALVAAGFQTLRCDYAGEAPCEPTVANLAGHVDALLPGCAGADGFILPGLSCYLTLPFEPSVDLACGIAAPVAAASGQLDLFS